MSQRPRALRRFAAVATAAAAVGGLLFAAFAASPAQAAGNDPFGPSVYSSYTPSDTNGNGVVGDIGDTMKVTYQLSNDSDTRAYTVCSLYATLVGAVGVDVPFSGSTLPKGSSAYKTWSGWQIAGSFTDTFYGSCKDSSGWHAWQATSISWYASPAPLRALSITGAASTIDTNKDGVNGDAGDQAIVTYAVTNTGEQQLTAPAIVSAAGVIPSGASIDSGATVQAQAGYTLHSGVNDISAYASSHSITPDNVTIASNSWGGAITASAAPVRTLSVSPSITAADSNGDGVSGDVGDTAAAHYVIANNGSQTLGIPTIDGGSLLGMTNGADNIAANTQQLLTKDFAITSNSSTISSSVTASAPTVTGDNVTVTSAPASLSWSAAAAPVRSLTVAQDGSASVADTNHDGVAGDTGDVISYTLTVTNTGDQGLGQITVHGAGTDAIAGAAGGTNAGATEQLVLQHTITDAEVTAGKSAASATAAARTTTPDNLVITSSAVALRDVPTVPAPSGGDAGKPNTTDAGKSNTLGTASTAPGGGSSTGTGSGGGSGSTSPAAGEKAIAPSFGFGFGPGATGGLPAQWPTSWTTKIQKVKTTSPTITSSVKTGEKLTIVKPVKAKKVVKKFTNTINGTPFTTWKRVTVTPKYQWYASGKKITGATGSTLTLTAATAGKQIVLKVNGHKVTTRVTLVASRVGATLTAHASKVPKGSRVGYQWYANGKALKTGTKAKFKVPASLKGKRLTVKFAVAKHGYAITTSKASAKTSVTAAAPKKPTTHKVTVTISTNSKAKVTVDK